MNVAAPMAPPSVSVESNDNLPAFVRNFTLTREAFAGTVTFEQFPGVPESVMFATAGTGATMVVTAIG